MFKSKLGNNLTGTSPRCIPVINSLRGLVSLSVCIFHLICLPLNFLEHTSIYQLAQFGKYGVQVFLSLPEL